jgi:hypothetical protein
MEVFSFTRPFWPHPQNATVFLNGRLTAARFLQRQDAQRRGQRLARPPPRIRRRHQRRQRLAARRRDAGKRSPERLLQRDAGPVARQGEAALYQPTQPPPPSSVAPGVVIAAGTTQRSKSSGRTKPSFAAASFSVMFSASAVLPIFTALS